MSEEQNTDQPVITPGPMLRQAREQLGLTTQQVAQRLNLRQSVVQGIEKDVYEANMSITYIRGYIRNYARLVGLDEQQLNESLDAVYKTETTQDMQSFSGRTTREKNDSRWWLLTWGIALLLLAAVGWWAFTSLSGGDAPLQLPKPASLAEPASTQPQQRQIEPQPQADDVSVPVSSEMQAGPQSVEAELVEPQVAQQTDSDQAGNVAEEGLAAAVTQVAESTVAVEPAVTDALAITLKADCWMLVEDAAGNKLVEGLKLAGYATQVTGAAPYKIRLGAPEAVQISFNGNAVDLSSFQAGKVARLTVPQ